MCTPRKSDENFLIRRFGKKCGKCSQRWYGRPKWGKIPPRGKIDQNGKKLTIGNNRTWKNENQSKTYETVNHCHHTLHTGHHGLANTSFPCIGLLLDQWAIMQKNHIVGWLQKQSRKVNRMRGKPEWPPIHPDSSWPATWVLYHTVPMWLLQVKSTIEGTLRVLCSYCMRSSFSAFWHSSVWVPSS